MTALLLLVASLISSETMPSTARLTADFSGEGKQETAIAVARGKFLQLEIHDSEGGLHAKVLLPAPAEKEVAVTLTAGSLGSAGSLLEVVAAGEKTECRSVWRYRDNVLMGVPLSGGPGLESDCGPRQSATRWERPAEDAPALYVREAIRETGKGALRTVEVFRYAGFRLVLDPERSSAWINGVEIPRWQPVMLYPPESLESLEMRFDLQAIRAGPRLRIIADREEGTFAVSAFIGAREEILPVTAVAETGKPRERMLTAGAGKASVRVLLSAAGTIPVEASLHGLGASLDRTYAVVERQEGDRIRFYGSAEEELARRYFPGLWDAGTEKIAATPLPGDRGTIRLGAAEFNLNIADAPDGVDLLLVPRDGTPPGSGLQLRGPNAFVEVRLRCRAPSAGGPPACDTPVPARRFRRAGARMNES